MFATACAVATQYTFPVAISIRKYSGAIGTGGGAFVVLNDAGWILTAAHIFNLAQQFDADLPKVAAHRAKADAIVNDATLKSVHRTRQLAQLERQADKEWITDISHWWSRPGLSLQDLTLAPELDLAVGRLDPYPAGMATAFPVLKNPTLNFGQGTSLCRLGFPFQELRSTFDTTTNTFSLSGQLVLFPFEGMFTRTLDQGRTSDGKHQRLFVETSSPGLKGHSGGPVFDVFGRIWGIQSRTVHIPLGFNPPAKIDGRQTTVPQFINLGVAIHSDPIVSVLRDLGVDFQLSPD